MSDDERFAPTEKDGFRRRRKRPKGWLKQAIKNGEIADPNAPIPDVEYDADTHVVSVPIATLDGGGTEQ